MKEFTGLYRGLVVGTENFERFPHRIRVSVPNLTGPNGTWASPCWPTPFSGRTSVPPQVGEGVWLMFEGGDLNYPVWMGFFGDGPATNLTANQGG